MFLTANQFHQNQEETSQIRSNQTHYSLPNPNSDQICQSYIDSTELDEINTLNKNRTIPTTSFPPQDFYSHPSFPLNPTLSQSHISSTHYYQTEYQSNLNNPSHSPSNELSTSNNSYDPFAQTSQYEWSYLPDSYSQYTNLVETPPSLPSSSLPSSPISPSPLPSPATIVKNNLTLAATNNNKLPKIMPYRSDATGFVTKLYWLLENVEEFGNCIKWDTKGKAFLVDISNQQFLEEILPDLFRHKSVTSFNRQLQTCKLYILLLQPK